MLWLKKIWGGIAAVPLNGEVNRTSGVYKSVCCGAEIVINAGSKFPDCANRPDVTTVWRPVINRIIGLTGRKWAFDAALEAHIENGHLFKLAVGRVKLDEREQNHLHRCNVCQSVLYVFVHQPTSTLAGGAEKPASAA